MKLINWGYDFEEAERIFVVRIKDIQNDLFLQKFVNLIKEYPNIHNPNDFFEQAKICILAKQETWIKFLETIRDYFE